MPNSNSDKQPEKGPCQVCGNPGTVSTHLRSEVLLAPAAGSTSTCSEFWANTWCTCSEGCLEALQTQALLVRGDSIGCFYSPLSPKPCDWCSQLAMARVILDGGSHPICSDECLIEWIKASESGKTAEFRTC